jgi:hypothetical protein
MVDLLALKGRESIARFLIEAKTGAAVSMPKLMGSDSHTLIFRYIRERSIREIPSSCMPTGECLGLLALVLEFKCSLM